MPQDVPGTVYLLHFNQPIGNPTNRYAMARHYIGWSPNLPERIAAHTAGSDAKIVNYVQRQGIGFVVARTWPGNYLLERQLKNRKCAPRMCPECHPPKGT